MRFTLKGNDLPFQKPQKKLIRTRKDLSKKEIEDYNVSFLALILARDTAAISPNIVHKKKNQRPTGSSAVEPVFGVATFERVLITLRDSKSLSGDTLVFLLGFGAPWSGHVANPTLLLYSSQRKPFVRPILWLFTSTCLLQCLPTKTVQTGFPLEMQAQFTFHVDRARGGCNPVPRFQSQHSRDPLPAGWFYNGVSYVSMTGEKNQHHPCIFYSSCGSRRVETM